MSTQDSRIKIKRSTVSGVVPTVPASNDHTDGTWIATDIYKGELYYNQADNILFTRDDSGIVTLAGSGGAGTLDSAYDFGGAGLGREIDAVDGAVKISGEDGLLVTGTFGSGADIGVLGGGAKMYFNPKKAAFRAGNTSGDEWDDSEVGNYSVAIGLDAKSVGGHSVSLGQTSEAEGDNSFAVSTGFASGDYSTAINNGIATGDRSTAIGLGSTSKSFSETAIGHYNTDYAPTSTSTWQATDRLFVIGNGQSSGTRADALIITKNGNLTMPTTTGAFSPPILTTTERNALTATAGMVIYNSTDSKHQGYDGTTWNDFY